MKKIIAWINISVLFVLTACSTPLPQNNPQIPQNNPQKEQSEWVGTWDLEPKNDFHSSTITITDVTQEKLSFSLSAMFITNADKTNANVGNIKQGIAILHGNEATFTDDGFQLKMTLVDHHLQVTTNDVIYFGAGVFVNGTYTKTRKEVSKETANYLRKDCLCKQNEDEIFGFTVKENNKLLSVCVANDSSYLVYRFGSQKNVELEFPANKSHSWNDFSYTHYIRGGGMANAGLDLNYLTFANGDYIYKIYEEYSATNNEARIGVTVLDKNNQQVTTIEGLPYKKVGSLAELQKSPVKKVPYYAD